jgi:tRNA(Ile)-lysidine synthase
MLKLLFTPSWKDTFGVACSGGLDSMTMLSFCINGGHKPVVLFFDHGIPEDQPGLEVVENAVKKFNLDFMIHKIPRMKDKKESQEEYWRKERYQWLYSLKFPVLTGHHLDDVVETWLFSSFHGNPKLIPSHTQNIHRPLLTTSRKAILSWAKTHDVEWHEDELNNDLRFARCRIRHAIVPEVLKVNPGIGTVLAKKLVERERQLSLEKIKTPSLKF